MSGRGKAVWASFELDLKLRRLVREELAARAEAGKAFRASVGADATLAAPVASALARVVALEEREHTLATRLADSLAADRRDYRDARSGLGRCLIVVRGLLDRLVLRDEAWSARRALPEHHAELAARVFDDEGALARMPAEPRQRVAEARAVIESVRTERAELLAPYGGRAVPGVLAAIVRELATFGAFVREEVTKRIFLRVPALAAMAVSWWLTQRYTSSNGVQRFFSDDHRSYLSEETLSMLSFWLPVFATALVGYASWWLSRRVRSRYLGPDAGDPGR